jgi:hypothetical protein
MDTISKIEHSQEEQVVPNTAEKEGITENRAVSSFERIEKKSESHEPPVLLTDEVVIKTRQRSTISKPFYSGEFIKEVDSFQLKTQSIDIALSMIEAPITKEVINVERIEIEDNQTYNQVHCLKGRKSLTPKWTLIKKCDAGRKMIRLKSNLCSHFRRKYHNKMTNLTKSNVDKVTKTQDLKEGPDPSMSLIQSKVKELDTFLNRMKKIRPSYHKACRRPVTKTYLDNPFITEKGSKLGVYDFHKFVGKSLITWKSRKKQLFTTSTKENKLVKFEEAFCLRGVLDYHQETMKTKGKQNVCEIIVPTRSYYVQDLRGVLEINRSLAYWTNRNQTY